MIRELNGTNRRLFNDRYQTMRYGDKSIIRRATPEQANRFYSVIKSEPKGILVDNEEHLYLCDDFIVTHNTVVCALSFVLYTMTHFNHQNAALAGKAQPLYSNLLTPEGYRKMGDIRVGDCVYNRKGEKVKVLDVSNFDTSEIKYIEYMFEDCSGLTALDVSYFDTTNVTNMALMFSGCNILPSLFSNEFFILSIFESLE